jgi:cell division protein FtsB
VKFQIKWKKILKSRYFITAAVFFIWILFFDQNNLITQIQYRLELNQLEEEKEFYKGEIEEIRSDLDELQSNPRTLEKFAREKYLMKKDNEELFVIVEEE